MAKANDYKRDDFSFLPECPFRSVCTIHGHESVRFSVLIISCSRPILLILILSPYYQRKKCTQRKKMAVLSLSSKRFISCPANVSMSKRTWMCVKLGFAAFIIILSLCLKCNTHIILCSFIPYTVRVSFLACQQQSKACHVCMFLHGSHTLANAGFGVWV